jgi:hypothetical protein
MRVRSALFVSLLLVSACTPAAPPAPAAPAPQIVGTLNQVMRGILFPNSNIIFDAQDRDPAADPDPNDPTASVHAFAGTYGKWEAVENAAIALSEAANLIAMPGRTCANGKPVPLQDETYQKGLAALRAIAAQTYKEAQAKNTAAMLDVADKMTQACATCHDVYRDKVVDGKPIGIADRCVQ